MASYNTIPKEEEPLIADAPKANHKSTAVIAAVCLLSAVAGFNNQKIYETMFYTQGQLYLGDDSIDGEVCLAIEGKKVENNAKLEVWDCKDNEDLAKLWSVGSGSEFSIKAKGTDYCVAGATRAKGFKEGSQFYLYKCSSGDDTQKFTRDGGRHLKYVHSDNKLCMAADGSSDGKAVRAKKCIDGNKYQKWKLYD